MQVKAALRWSWIVEAKEPGIQLWRLDMDVVAKDRDGSAAVLRDRQRGQSLGQLARNYQVSRSTVHRVLHERAAATLPLSA